MVVSTQRITRDVSWAMAIFRLEATSQCDLDRLSNFASTCSEMLPENAKGPGGHNHVPTPNRPLMNRGISLGFFAAGRRTSV